MRDAGRVRWNDRGAKFLRRYQQEYYLTRRRAKIEKAIAVIEAALPKCRFEHQADELRIEMRELRLKLSRVVLQKRKLKGAA